MRFTTWSTLTNAFIISTVALLSLIQAANALDLYIVAPNSHDSPFFPGGPITIKWAAYNYAEIPPQESRAIVSLVNEEQNYTHNYQQQVPIYSDRTSIGYVSEINVVFPEDVKVPNTTYYIQFITYVGKFNSSHFTII